MNLGHIARIERAPEEARRIALTATVVGKTVELHLLGQRHCRIDNNHLIFHRRIAKAVVDAIEGGFARVGLTVDQWKLLARVGTRTIGGVTEIGRAQSESSP